MTAPRWNRRLLAGVGTTALAATALAGLTLGAGEANAAKATADGSVRVYKLGAIEQWVDVSRTVNKRTVNQGDEVTISTKISAHALGTGLAVTVQNIQDWTPDCLAYVAGSGKATAHKTLTGAATADATTGVGYIEAASDWGIGIGNADRSVTLTAKYTVNCAPGKHNTGGLNAHTTPSSDGANAASGGWLNERSTGTGAANPPSKLKESGPEITVKEAGSGSSDGSIGDLFGSGSSDGSSDGSLGNLFGSS